LDQKLLTFLQEILDVGGDFRLSRRVSASTGATAAAPASAAATPAPAAGATIAAPAAGSTA
jgi:hypothetical protein